MERFCCAAWIFWPMVCVCILVVSGMEDLPGLAETVRSSSCVSAGLRNTSARTSRGKSLASAKAFGFAGTETSEHSSNCCLMKRNGPCLRVGLLGQRLPCQRLKPDRHRAQDALAHQVADILRHRPLVGFDPDDLADQLAVLDANIRPAPDHLAAVVIEQHRRIALELVELPAGGLDDVAHAVDRTVGQNELIRLAARRRGRALRIEHGGHLLFSRTRDCRRVGIPIVNCFECCAGRPCAFARRVTSGLPGSISVNFAPASA